MITVRYLLTIPLIILELFAMQARGECQDCNVIIISIDTLRPDALGVYGNPRSTTPTIDEFARTGILFEQARSTSPKTASSHMSMFTALPPEAHGVCNVSAKAAPGCVGLPATVKTLAEILQGKDYDTVGYTGGGNVVGELGFARGFRVYEHHSDRSIEQAVEFLVNKKKSPGKFFLFIHTYHMHDPYVSDPPYDTLYNPAYKGKILGNRSKFNSRLAGDKKDWWNSQEFFWSKVDSSKKEDLYQLRALYDGLAKSLDDRIKPLLSAVRSLQSNSVIILTSDHGEEFFEHKQFQHKQLYDETLRVPLVLSYPDQIGPARIQTAVSLAGLSPTVLTLIGSPLPEQFRREQSWPVSQNSAQGAETYSQFLEAGQSSLVADQQKVISHGFDASGERCEFYDLQSDQSEQKNLGCMNGPGKAKLEKLKLYRSRIADPNAVSKPAPSVSSETLKQLKSLGYLN